MFIMCYADPRISGDYMIVHRQNRRLLKMHPRNLAEGREEKRPNENWYISKLNVIFIKLNGIIHYVSENWIKIS